MKSKIQEYIKLTKTDKAAIEKWILRPGVGTDIYGNKSYEGVDYLTNDFIKRIEYYLKDAKESNTRK